MTVNNRNNLTSLAKVIRSKNAGPYELTFDIIFNDAETMEKVKSSGAITKKLIADLYKISESDVLKLVYFPPANALKITIKRPTPAGSLQDTDVYGAQQHAPLLQISI